MKRCEERELLDEDRIDPPAVAKAYRELDQVQRLLGTTSEILRLLREEKRATYRDRGTSEIRVLDIGCGQGALLARIQAQLGFDVVGFDVRPAPEHSLIPILPGNAVSDVLPRADVAICVMMAHHLSPRELQLMIANISRSCRRLILVDLVRHSIPLALFQIFLCPFLSRINALDGQTSIRRAFTVSEMRKIVADTAKSGTRNLSSIRHWVAPLWMRQVVDIRWQVDGRVMESADSSAAAAEMHTAADR